MGGLKPGITVVIPTIPPRKKMLKRALASVEAQTLQAADVIISEDIHHLGAAATRNRALEGVHTEWVAFLDDDDEFLPNHLEMLCNRAVEDDADLVYPWFEVINGVDPLTVDFGDGPVSPFGVFFGFDQKEYLQNKGNFIPVTHLSKTDLVQTIGGFPQPGSARWPHQDNEDWGFLRDMLAAGAKFVHEPTKTWHWHHGHANTSGRSDRW